MTDLTNRQLAAFLTSLFVCAVLVAIGAAHVELMGSPFALLVQTGGRRGGSSGDSMKPPPPNGPAPPPHGPSQILGKMLFSFTLSLFLLLASCMKQGAPTAPVIEAGTAVANDVCSLIEGIDDDSAVRSICATVDEVAQIISFVTMLRGADAGAREREIAECTPLPGTAFCATSRERAKAILFVVRTRMARFTLAPPPATATP